MHYDLIVIGGGIVGCAIAKDAALRGLSVLLIEKQDFGSGASTKTSKLLHGGLRYLETLELKLVRESMRERNALLITDPFLAKPLRFVLPVYADSDKKSWMINLGLKVYDLLSWGSIMPRSKPLTPEESNNLYPFLKKKGLRQCFHYFDGAMKDSRILIETLLGAKEAGAALLNYTLVTDFLYRNGKVAGVCFESQKRGLKATATATAVVVAAGSSADEVRSLNHEQERVVRRSKGVHLVLKKRIADDAVIMTSPIDGRVFFLLPWEGKTLLGTTDTELRAGEEVLVEREDIRYLLSSVNHYLENNPLTEEDIASSFAGVRPLILEQGKDSYTSTRSLKMISSKNGLVTVIGGKYTTFRRIAEKVVDALYRSHFQGRPFVSCITYERPVELSRMAMLAEVEMAEAIASGFHLGLVQALKSRWGSRFALPLKVILSCKDNRVPICPHHPALVGELLYAVESEEVFTASDWMERRTPYGYFGLCSPECFLRIDQLIGKHL
ncbi:glycerol-3-phosphate dehydrogenase/oxidase [Estrella lausannensis]|uniref:Glycerol-3-phosphate dehydrogenase n=1 Tax=Estrella lausannensis TaxID=483423 RepID=A0A0H5DP23_9BACT|nr:glycerol-3-phosphate dehydrogenase/oxidase [Estrella lausannensis]CRX38226.1 Glycerol-3-phosphate dehydrogenase [Estrella lausannensis]